MRARAARKRLRSPRSRPGSARTRSAGARSAAEFPVADPRPQSTVKVQAGDRNSVLRETTSGSFKWSRRSPGRPASVAPARTPRSQLPKVMRGTHPLAEVAVRWARYAGDMQRLTFPRFGRVAPCLLALAWLPETCRAAPALEVAGAYVPAWLCCALGALAGTIVARAAMVVTGLALVLPLQLLVSLSMGSLLAALVWVTWIGL